MEGKLHDLMTTMKQEQTKVAVTFADILNFIGGVSGLIALATLVFMGGSIVEKIRSLDLRVTAIESAGSATLRTHIAADAQMDESINARLRMLEENIVSLHRIETKLETASTKLDMMKEQMTQHISGKL